MARAYICFARNDMADNLLQILDLRPNSSLRVPSLEGAGQTGYITHLPQSDTVVTHDGGAGVRHTSDVYYGLAAYLLDNVEDIDNGNICLTDLRANTITTNILATVAAGTALTVVAINALIAAQTGGGGASTLVVGGGSWSSGTVAEVLRILSGEVYSVATDSVMSAAAAGWLGHGAGHTRVGGFVASTSTAYRQFRTMVDTGELHLSMLTGALSHLAVATYAWENPAFTYTATGTALTVGGTHITAGGVAQALTVYDASGNVI